MKKNIKKVVSIGVASALCLTGFAPSFGAVSHFVSQDTEGSAYQYNKTELESSFVDDKIGGDGKLYKNYNTSKTLKALNDTKKGYVDYKDVEQAYLDAKISLDKTFSVDGYTESGKAKPYQMPNKVYDVSVDANGNVIQTPISENEKLQITSVKPVTDSKIVVTFSKPIDFISSSNFSIQGMSIVSAELSEDKKEASITVSGAELEKEYTLVTKYIQIGGDIEEDISSKFTMPKASELFKINVSIADDLEEIKADNNTSVLVTFDLVDASGDRLDANNVELKLSSTFGTFAENRVTVQKGKATALFNSEVLDSAKDSLLSVVVVEASNKNLINIRAEKTLRLNPNPDTGENQSTGLNLTDVAADMADRVILYFNKDVDLTKYVATDTTNGYDPKKLEINIKTNADNSEESALPSNVVVKALKPVEGNSKALYAILDVDTDDETTNLSKKVSLTDNARLIVNVKDHTKTVKTDVTKSSVLTDARRPSILAVNRDGFNKIVVTFSEPVIGYPSADYPNSASNLENWVLDGTKLSENAWGRTTKAKVEIGKFDEKTGEDKRHIATITLGKDVNGKQIYLQAGVHSIQGAKIGDYADLTDKGNNIINTQTMDFVIPENNDAPTAKVDVQSPEQYLVTFSSEIEQTNLNKIIKLQKFNTSSNSWEDETKQEINVRKVADTGNKFIVEVKKDWTDDAVYNTKSTNKNYYNDSYRLAIDEKAVTSASSGNPNAKIEMLLEGVMKTPDLVSPVIEDIKEKTKGEKYLVTMSEPVKFADGGGSGDSFPTPSQGQLSVNEINPIPTPTAQFIKSNNNKTVEATVVASDDPYNKELLVTPNSILESGEWKLVVRSISDDIGNTAASSNKNFTVSSNETNEEFRVQWAVVDDNGVYDSNTNTIDKNQTHDYVFIKFSNPIKIANGFATALSTTNYTLNGDPLPKGTQITGGIEGYKGNINYIDSVTIKVPKGTITSAESTVITISQYILNEDGDALASNGGQFKLPYNFASGKVSNIDELNTALENKDIKKIIITNDIDLNTFKDKELVINRPVHIYMEKDKKLIGSDSCNLKIKTNETGSMSIDGAGNNVINGNLTVMAPNMDVTIGPNMKVEYKTKIADIAEKTFINNGELKLVEITDPNKAGFINGGTIESVEVNTTGEVNLGGNFNVDIKVMKPVILKLKEGFVSEKKIIVEESAKGASIKVPNSVSLPPIDNKTGESITITDGNNTAQLPATDADKPVVELASIKIDGQVQKIENATSIDIKVDDTKTDASKIEDLKVIVKEVSGMTVSSNNAKVNSQLSKLGFDNFNISPGGKISADLTGVDLTAVVKSLIGDKPLKDFIGKSIEFTLTDKSLGKNSDKFTINIVRK